jgi:hypothetical protein
MSLSRLAFALLCCAASSGCGEAAPPAAPAPAEHGGSPLLTWDASKQEAFMEALSSGVLTREGRCVYLVNGSHRTLLVLPRPHARWDAERGTIRMSGRELRFGKEIGIGGGSVAGLDATVAEEAKQRGCDTSNAWWGSPDLVDISVLRQPPRVNPPPPPLPKE